MSEDSMPGFLFPEAITSEMSSKVTAFCRTISPIVLAESANKESRGSFSKDGKFISIFVIAAVLPEGIFIPEASMSSINSELKSVVVQSTVLVEEIDWEKTEKREKNNIKLEKFFLFIITLLLSVKLGVFLYVKFDFLVYYLLYIIHLQLVRNV